MSDVSKVLEGDDIFTFRIDITALKSILLDYYSFCDFLVSTESVSFFPVRIHCSLTPSSPTTPWQTPAEKPDAGYCSF